MGAAISSGGEKPPPVSAFREESGGATLSLGGVRRAGGAVAVGASFSGLGVFLVLVTILFAADISSERIPGVQLVGILMIVAGIGFVVFAGLDRASWTLHADEEGVHLLRGQRRPRDLPWGTVKSIRYGPTAFRSGRYAVRLADAIWIDIHRSMNPIILDTIHFRVSADDLDRMAAVLKDLARRHSVPVEPFPVAGRSGP